MKRLARWSLTPWITLALVASIPTDSAAESPEQIFDRGNAAYEQQDYAEAAEAYRTVLRYGIEDPRVEYNLANAEFRLGRLGSAILHYERARRLDPVDPDIRDNLEFARTFCYDQVISPEGTALLRWLHGWQDRLGPDRQAWATLGLGWVICAVVAWGLAKPGRWSPAIGWFFASVLLVTSLAAWSWHATYQRLEATPLAVVLASSAEVLAGPGGNNPTLFVVHEGLTVEVRDVREEWIQVALPNGLNGWLPRDRAGLV